ncbi:hypothetical protein KKC91_00880 [bacterium]|nr:hypothetical protein [bacterium]
MKHYIVCFLLLSITGCATEYSTLKPSQRRLVEAKELEGSFDIAYKATMQVLQDNGYIIASSDYNGGVIKGETGWKPRGIFVPRQYEVSVLIEAWGENKVKERLTFLLKEDLGLGSQRSRLIEDPKQLQRFYDEIQREIFIRQNLNR